MRATDRSAAAVLPAALLLCATAAAGEPLYRDVSGRLGLDDPDLFTMDLAVADVDGDGDPDLVLALEFAPNRLLLNDGRGRFRDAAGWAPEVAHDSEETAAGDFDADGDVDLVIVSEDDQVDSYLLGDGSGRFVDAPDGLLVALITNAVLAIDADGDGDLDLVLGNRGPDVLLVNDGGGTFTPDPAFPGGATTTQDLAAGDVDGDGRTDIVVGDEGPNRLLLARGAGFAERTDAFPGPPGETRDVELFDADGDGDLDVYASNVALLTDRDPLDRLYLNDGKGAFTDVTERSLPVSDASTMDAAAADLDGDGDPDLLLATFGDLTGRTWTSPVRTLLNRGDGRFVDGTADVLPPGTIANGMDIVVADLDGDGRAEIVVASRGGPNLMLAPADRP